MKHTIASPESALALLQQTLPESDALTKKTELMEEFEVKLARMFMKQAFADDPTVIALPDGRSILVAVMHAHPALALDWWRMRGSQAWQRTPKNPSPGREVIEHELYSFEGHYNTFNWSDGCKSAAERKAFLLDAIKSGNVLKNSDVQEWADGKISNKQLANMANDQEVFVSLCLKQTKRAGMISQHQVIKHLLAGDAVLPYGIEFDVYELVDKKSFPPTQLMLDKYPIPESNNSPRPAEEHLWRPWHEVWERGSYHPNAQAVMAWLDKEGIDTAMMRASLLTERLNSIVGSVKHNKLNSAQTWDRIAHDVNEANGWQMEKEGELVWQYAVSRLPAIIPAMIDSPPPCGLDARSSTGMGLWDVLATGRSRQDPSRTVLRKLHSALPIAENPPAKALFWVWGPWRDNADAMNALFVHAANKNPDPAPWIGASDDYQLSMAARIMAGLCSQGADLEVCRHLTRNLFSGRLDFSTPTPFTTLAMPVIAYMAKMDQDLKETCVIDWQVAPAHVIQHAKHASKLATFIKRAIKREKSSLRRAPMEALKAAAAQLSMSTKTPAVVPAQGEPAVARPPRL